MANASSLMKRSEPNPELVKALRGRLRRAGRRMGRAVERKWTAYVRGDQRAFARAAAWAELWLTMFRCARLALDAEVARG